MQSIQKDEGVHQKQQQRLLAEWYRRIVLSSQGHYNTAQHLGRLNWLLGIPVVCLSAVVGTSVFATLERDVQSGYRIVVGMVSVMAAVLASLQTFLGFAERAERHRIFGAHYGALRREIEVLFAKGEVAAAEFDKIALERWFAEDRDARSDSTIGLQISEFIERHGVKSVVMADRIIGCPHEEGVDYPEGQVCPQCPFWAHRDRWTGDVIH